MAKKIIDAEQQYSKGQADGQVLLARIILMNVNHANLDLEQKLKSIEMLCEQIVKEHQEKGKNK